MSDKHGLKKMLIQLVKQATAHPGQPQRKPLERGLRVDVLIKDGRTYLQISRENKWPSPEEWRIVARDFPQPVPNVTPRRIFDSGAYRYFLKADWEPIIAEQPALIQ